MPDLAGIRLYRAGIEHLRSNGWRPVERELDDETIVWGWGHRADDPKQPERAVGWSRPRRTPDENWDPTAFVHGEVEFTPRSMQHVANVLVDWDVLPPMFHTAYRAGMDDLTDLAVETALEHKVEEIYGRLESDEALRFLGDDLDGRMFDPPVLSSDPYTRRMQVSAIAEAVASFLDPETT